MTLYHVKIKINAVTIHDLKKIIDSYLDEDYWSSDNDIEIYSIDEGENQQ